MCASAAGHNKCREQQDLKLEVLKLEGEINVRNDKERNIGREGGDDQTRTAVRYKSPSHINTLKFCMIRAHSAVGTCFAGRRCGSGVSAAIIRR